MCILWVVYERASNILTETNILEYENDSTSREAGAVILNLWNRAAHFGHG